MSAPPATDDEARADADVRARLVEDLVLSGPAAALYPEGGFPADADTFARLRDRPSRQTRVLAEVFASFRLERPEPALLAGGTEAARRVQRDDFAALAARPAVGPAALLCESRDIRFSGNALYYVEDGRPRVLFETFRPNDRYFADGPGADFSRVDEDVPADGLTFLLNSAGSFNYGHWLTDDLPRLAGIRALRRLHPRAPLTIALVAYGQNIDEVRRRSIHLCLPGERTLRVRFLDRSRTYRFERLHHVTPVSLPPGLKSPEALRALSGQLHAATRAARWKASARRFFSRSGGSGARLFVDRNPLHGRRLLNREAVIAHLARRGFVPFDPERCSLTRQVVRFGQARAVVGIAGAAMANTVFCAPRTPLVYLMPEGWRESFYWDLAAVRGHRYAAVLGREDPTPGEAEFQRAFTIDLADLDAGLSAMGLLD